MILKPLNNFVRLPGICCNAHVLLQGDPIQYKYRHLKEHLPLITLIFMIIACAV